MKNEKAMLITLNGKEHIIDEGCTLTQLALKFNLSPEKVIIEKNKKIVPAEAFNTTKLEEGDELEMLQFVGGG